MASHLSSQVKCFFGNDTIDSYPLQHCGEIQKILCVSVKTFEAIKKDFEAFFKGDNGYLKPSTFNIEPYRGQNSELKVASQAINPILTKTVSPEFFRDFEPSNTIYLQYSDIRRWRRVNEWFRQYAPYGAQE